MEPRLRIGQAGSDKVDAAEEDEVIDAIAKTVAELTSQQDGTIRQKLIEQLTHEIMQYDGEFRREEATSAVGSSSKQRRFGSRGAQFAPRVRWLGRGVIGRAARSPQLPTAAEHPSRLSCG